MSDDLPAVPVTEETEAEAPVRPRRAVSARAKKTAASPKKPAEPESEPPPSPVAEEAPATEDQAPPPQRAAVGEWPEAENATNPAATAEPPNKRKRRRRKGKGSSNSTGNASPEEVHPLVTDQAPSEPLPGQSARPPEEPRPSPPPSPRRKVDPDLLAKKAWKIFLSEVSEEGVALIGDNDAKELSRRCFRLAEIFLDERARRAFGQ